MCAQWAETLIALQSNDGFVDRWCFVFTTVNAMTATVGATLVLGGMGWQPGVWMALLLNAPLLLLRGIRIPAGYAPWLFALASMYVLLAVFAVSVGAVLLMSAGIVPEPSWGPWWSSSGLALVLFSLTILGPAPNRR